MRLIKLFQSKTFRLSVLFLLVLSGITVAIFGAVYWSTRSFIAQQTDETIKAEVAGLLELHQQGDLDLLVATVRERSRQAQGAIYLIVKSDLHPVTGNLEKWPPSVSPSAVWFNFNFEVPTSTGGVVQQEARARNVTLPGGYQLLVGRNVYEQKKIQRLTTNALMFATFVTGVVGVVVAAMITAGFLHRIDLVNKTCAEVMAGDLSQRIPSQPESDELDQLSENINSMLDRIERLMFGMRKVTDHIAHELRSPLNRMRVRLESTLRQKQTPEEYEDVIVKTIAEADELVAVFNSLLNIAHAESGASGRNRQAVDLGETVAGIADLYEPVAEEKGIDFGVEIDQGAIVMGNTEMLAQAAANLIDNAIKYTPKGGRIEVAVKTDAAKGQADSSVSLIVRDTGPGIPIADRDRVLERFIRLETDSAIPGVGLGLSLVSAVAKLHEARFVLTDHFPGRTPPGLRAMLLFKGLSPSLSPVENDPT